jgi:hypothetical protein
MEDLEVLVVLKGVLSHNHHQAPIPEFMIHVSFLLPSNNNHLFLRESLPSTFYTAESNHSHLSTPFGIHSSHAETIGKVGLSGCVLLLCDAGTQNIGHGRNLGQDESL